MADLKPCPFCGGEAHDPDAWKEKRLREAGLKFRPSARFISCKDCKARVFSVIPHNRVMDGKYQKQAILEAVEKWNRRVNHEE